MEPSNIVQGGTKKYDIPLNHLDFHYISECSDLKELEKILRVLRSKEEGFYPQLEACCEDKIKSLNPNSRILRKDNPLYTKNDLDKKEREELEEDLKNWSSELKDMESSMGAKENDMAAANEDEDLPPIRSGTITLTADGAKSSKPEVKTNKRATPRDYREWDKIDIDKELEKVDETDKKGKERTVVANKDVRNLPNHIDAKGLTEAEKLLKANREKDKGNEAFRSNDFKEAVTYYSRSISLQPTAASYNNRALAYLRTNEWQKAVNDTNTVLDLEQDNIKALMRRATAYKGLKQPEKAWKDISRVLELEPNNKKAQELLEQIGKEKEEKKKKGRRMIIEDVDGEEDSDKLATGDNQNSNINNGKINKGHKSEPAKSDSNKGDQPEQKTSRRLQIEEVDSDSDDEEQEIIGASAKCSSESEKDNKNNTVNGQVSKENIHSNGTLQDNEKHSDEQVNNGTKNDIESTNSNAGKIADISADNREKVGRSAVMQDTTNGDDSAQVTSFEEKSEVENDEDGAVVENASAEEEEDELVSNSDTEFVDAPEELRRPVFHITELPEKAVNMKEDATNLFRSGQYGEACKKYSEVIQMLEKAGDQIVNLSLMYSNRAACYLKTGDLAGAVKDCNSSLQLVPHSVKPLLRRASAYEHLERYSLAYVDYRHVLLLDSHVDQAHLGTKRCQHMLSENNGPNWRDKIHLQKVSPWQIPDIIGLDGKSTNPVVSMHVPPASQSNQVPVASSHSEPSITTPSPAKEEVPKEEVPKQKQPELTPQERFDALKAEGNNFVKEGQFQKAVECYSQCEEVLPGQTAVYTNRALCYIRTNQAAEAEEDCTKALAQEKDNVKALFRRAQARKMLKRYREGIEDLKHLLQVEPGNTPAQKEMELLKNYWREELEGMKKNLAEKKEKKAELSSDVKEKTSDSKQRKRVVIQEVESEEEEKSSTAANKKDAKTGKPKVQEMKKESDTKSKTKQVKTSKDSKQDQTQAGSKQAQSGSKQTQADSKQIESDSKQAQSDSKQSQAGSKQTESDSKQAQSDSKQTQTGFKQTQAGSKQTESDSKPTQSGSKQSQSGSNKRDRSSKQKSEIKETSQGLPSVPKAAPKLDKATPYEFISAWNALKKTETVKPYYDLLKQIKPSDIKTVISNKLDDAMLRVITKCVAEHFLPNGEVDTSYEILKNLSTVPRFSTVAMFMNKTEKAEVKAVLDKLESLEASVYSASDITELRNHYSV